jgi:HlyD family secretion protein
MGTSLVEIGNTSAIEITTDLLTADAMAVTPGAAAFVREWGGNPLPAKVRRIEPAAFTKISALGLEEQRVRAILDLSDPPPPALGHDLHVSVAIVVWEGRNVLTIPSTALFRSGSDWSVFTVHDGRAHLTTVQPSKSDAFNTVVERGLVEGEEVVTQPSDLLRDGMRVKSEVGPTTGGHS